MSLTCCGKLGTIRICLNEHTNQVIAENHAGSVFLLASERGQVFCKADEKREGLVLLQRQNNASPRFALAKKARHPHCY